MRVKMACRVRIKRFFAFYLRPLNAYLRNERAGIAVIAAFAALPLIFATTLAIEFARVTYTETRLKFAVDAAAIAAARYDLSQAESVALRFFRANFPDGFMEIEATPIVTILDNNSRIRVEVNTRVPAILGLILGRDGYDISTATEVNRQTTRLEVAMVLDVTGSMNSSGKMQSLRTAATNFVDILSGVANNTQQLNPNIYISMVPYVASVNVGSDKTRWLSNPSVVTSSFTTRTPWKGCVFARTNLNEENQAPNPNAKWPTYFTPPNTTYNEYRFLGNGTVRVEGPRNSSLNSLYTSMYNIGPNRSCGEPIIPLTNNYNALKLAISRLQPNGGGGTLANIGLVWGWRTISPNWTGPTWGWGGVVDPVPYNTPNTRKSVVIMTDGVNEIGEEESAYGLLSEGKLGTTNRSAAVTEVNRRMLTVCNNMKAQGIEVYTVTFMLTNTATQNLFRSCATKPEWYFNAQNGSQLQEYFQNIANLIQRIRVTL